MFQEEFKCPLCMGKMRPVHGDWICMTDDRHQMTQNETEQWVKDTLARGAIINRMKVRRGKLVEMARRR